MMFFVIGFASQWYIRRHYPNLFVRYNYLVSAAMDGGTAVMVFILSFAVLGAAGAAVAFREYAIYIPLDPMANIVQLPTGATMLAVIRTIATKRHLHSTVEVLHADLEASMMHTEIRF